MPRKLDELLAAAPELFVRLKPKRRKKPGPGHPVTTGSAATTPVFYRVSASQRAELDKEGKRRGISGNLVAKLRAFPTRHPQVIREEP